MTITTLLSGLPARTMDQTTFDLAVAKLMTDLPTFGAQVNQTEANLNSIAAGGAYAIPYTFDAATADADPGPGFLRLGSAVQNVSTVLRLDLFSSAGSDWTNVLDTFDGSTSVNKGQIRLVKLGDATKWLTFNVTSRAAPAGYRNITISGGAGSSASPFTAGDPLALFFTRTGDTGGPGTVVPRVTSIASSATPTPSATTDDQYNITALAAAATFGVPTGAPYDGQKMMIRVKDNGTARVLAFTVTAGGYRAGTDLAFPSTTVVSKVLYMGFVYNSLDTKWDLVAVLNNI